MQQYFIGITRTWQIILVLVFAPLIGGPFILLWAMYGPSLPEWAVLMAIYTLMSIGIIITFLLIKKVQYKATLTIKEDGFSVDFEERNLFTPHPFEVKINELRQLKLGGKAGLYYLSFSTSVYPFSFNAEGRTKREEDQTDFYEMAELIAKMLADKAESQSV